MMNDKKAYTVSLTIILILVAVNGYLTFFAKASYEDVLASIQLLQINHAR